MASRRVLPVAFSFLVINLLGAWLFLGGEAGLVQFARNSVGSVASFSLTPIPLFILMGEVLFHTGLAVKVIDGVEKVTRFNRERFGSATNEKSYPTLAERRAFAREIDRWLRDSSWRSRSGLGRN